MTKCVAPWSFNLTPRGALEGNALQGHNVCFLTGHYEILIHEA